MREGRSQPRNTEARAATEATVILTLDTKEVQGEFLLQVVKFGPSGSSTIIQIGTFQVLAYLQMNYVEDTVSTPVGAGVSESAGIFHMMDEVKSAETESALPADTEGADGAAAAAEGAGRPSASPADEMARLSDEIVDALKTVYDPEIPADLYELGLIYKVDIDDDRMVTIDMTLTTPNCPSAAELPGQVENAVANVFGVREARVNIVWDPPWDPSRMSDEARTELNMW